MTAEEIERLTGMKVEENEEGVFCLNVSIFFGIEKDVLVELSPEAFIEELFVFLNLSLQEMRRKITAQVGN
jgi:hypothetical protein